MSGLSQSSLIELAAGESVRPSRSGLRRIVSEGITWISESASFPLEEIDLKLWLKESAATIVKTGPHRTVYRVRLESGVYYVKHNRCNSWKVWFQNLLRTPKAIREWNAARQFQQASLPTYEPVAVGWRRSCGFLTDSFLITREIPGTIPLDEFLSRAKGTYFPHEIWALRRELAVRLGKLVGEMHRAGFIHSDLHCGNILVRRLDDGSCRLWIIDLQSVGHASTEAPRSWSNLALLHHLLAGQTTRTDRLCFYRSYSIAFRGNTLPIRGISEREELSDLEVYWKRASRHFNNRGDRHFARGNRHIIRYSGKKLHWRGLTVLGKQQLERVAQDPDQYFEGRVKSWRKSTGRNRVAIVDFEGTEAFWKSNLLRGVRALLHRIGRRTRVRQAWEMGHALRRRQVPTPRPLLMIERYNNGSLRQDLLTESIPNATTLRDFALVEYQTLTVEQQQDWRTGVIELLARYLKILHEERFDHRDLKASNLLVSRDHAHIQLWLLDLDTAGRWFWLPPQRIVQNLSRLQVSSATIGIFSSTDSLRFLKKYLGETERKSWKGLWQRISGRSETKVARNLRRGRPLT